MIKSNPDMLSTQPLKGFRDFYPEQMAFQNWFYQNLKAVSESFGFQEYEGPTLESLDLYAAKSGEELVKKQAFTLQDKSGNILALRPEMTPSLSRMIAQAAGRLTFPVKWFTYGRRFRYEQPQKGRGREFFQWDIDILGTDSFAADAEIISIAASFYKKLGLTPQEVKIKINDRKFLQEKLSAMGIDPDLTLPLIKVIDKRSKVTTDNFNTMLADAGLGTEKASSLLNILDDKDGYKNSEWLTGILNIIKQYGFDDYVEFDPGIVRGLDYYTRTVFEGWDVKGEFRSIWGGGRYDNLTQDVGASQTIPGVGFAMGDMVMEEVLKKCGKFPALTVNKTRVLVTVFSPELFDKSIELSNILRRENTLTELYPDPRTKLERQLKYAARKGIPYVAIIGPEEMEKGLVTLKNMSNGEQKMLQKEQVVEQLI